MVIKSEGLCWMNVKAGEGVLCEEEEGEKDGGGGVRASGAAVWRSFSAGERQRAEAECGVAAQPHVCDEIEG